MVAGRRPPDKWKAVAALDFGTTYSGFAYCIRTDGGKEPEIVTNPPWNTGATDIAFPKTSTTILFNSKGEFTAFGFEAESKYAKLVLRNKHADWYYFTQFKMSLYSEYGKLRRLNRSFRIEDVQGKHMNAMTVFAEAIRFLKTRLEDSMKENGHDVRTEEVRWVLTVPAIWDHAAKQFMRESAEQAGIPGHQLVLALEPEAATLHVMTLSKVKGGYKVPLLQQGTKFINLDLGGGTADVTVHQVSGKGQITELHRPSGGYWGGTQVDNSFDKLLASFVGAPVLTAWKRAHQPDYLDLKKDFEASKRSFAGNLIDDDDDDEVTIRIPGSLSDTVKDKTENTLDKIVKNRHEDGSVIFAQPRLIIASSTFEKLFKVSVDGIVDHLNNLLRQVSGVSTLVLVGGFSQSDIVKNAIKKNFGNLDVCIPDQPGLTVLKGATLFGLQPQSVATRVSPYTYGVMLFRPYESGDPQEYKVEMNHQQMTRQVFDIHVKAGDSLEIGKSSIKRNYTGVNPDSGKIILFVYRSTEKEPKFVNERGCVELGDLEIKVPKGDMADVEVEIKYWDTEIVVSAFEKNTRETASARLDTLIKT